MILQHLPDFVHDGFHGMHIGIANADGLVDPAIGHPGRVLHRDGGKRRVGDIKRALVERANGGQSPSDVLYRAFYVAIRGTHPVTHFERAVQVNNEAAKEVCQQVFGSKTNGDTTHTTKGQHPGNTEPQCLQGGQRCGNNHDRSRQLADGIDRGVIHRLAHLDRRGEDILELFDQPNKKPDHHPDKTDLKQRSVSLEDLSLGKMVSHFGSPIHPLEPHESHDRATDRVQNSIIPKVMSAGEFALQRRNHMTGNIGNRRRAQHQQENQHTGPPTLRQQPELLYPAIQYT